MTTLVIVALLIVIVAAGYLLLEKRPGYGVYYGLAKLTGARLDIGQVDWATLRRHRTPNDALVCPAQQCPQAKSDREAPIFALEPSALLARLREVARADANTVELPGERDTARFIQYTRLMRYPDTIDIEVFPVGGQATLAIYSRSLIGHGDFGVNRARIERWLAALAR